MPGAPAAHPIMNLLHQSLEQTHGFFGKGWIAQVDVDGRRLEQFCTQVAKGFEARDAMRCAMPACPDATKRQMHVGKMHDGVVVCKTA